MHDFTSANLPVTYVLKITAKVGTTQQWWISIKEQSDASTDKRTFLVSKITQLGCCLSQQVTEVSTFILHLKLYLAFLSVFIVMTYNNMTSDWLWKSAEITLKILLIQQQGIITNKRSFLQRCKSYLCPFVSKSASNCVLSTSLKIFPEKLVSGSETSCEGLCGPRQISGIAVQVHTNNLSFLDRLYILAALLVFISELQTVPCRQARKLFSKTRRKWT